MAVDDEADITFTLKKELEQSGLLVDVFNGPTSALSNFKPDYYDLILLDVKMPQMNGFELYQAIKKKDKNVKVFLSRYTAKDGGSVVAIFVDFGNIICFLI
jgi:DNA-binding response OmpR family regulator